MNGTCMLDARLTFLLYASSQTRLSLVTKNKLPRHRPGQNASVCSAIPHSLSGAMHSLWCHLDCPMRPGLCNASWTVKCQHTPSTESVPRALLWLRQKASPPRTTALSTDIGLLYSPIRPQAPIIALALSVQALPPSHPATASFQPCSIPIAPARRSLAFLGRARASAKGLTLVAERPLCLYSPR